MPTQPKLQNYSSEDIKKAKKEADFFGIPTIGSTMTLGKMLSYLTGQAKDKIGSYLGGEAGNLVGGEKGREIGSTIGSFLSGFSPSSLKSGIKYAEGVEDPNPSPLEKLFKENRKFNKTNYTPLPPGGIKEIAPQEPFSNEYANLMDAYDVWARRHPTLMRESIDDIQLSPFMIGNNGTFSFAPNSPKTIDINKWHIKNDPNATLPTLAHESTHAAQRIRRQEWNPEEYKKILTSKEATYLPFLQKWSIMDIKENTPYWHKLEDPAYRRGSDLKKKINDIYPERMTKIDKIMKEDEELLKNLKSKKK